MRCEAGSHWMLHLRNCSCNLSGNIKLQVKFHSNLPRVTAPHNEFLGFYLVHIPGIVRGFSLWHKNDTGNQDCQHGSRCDEHPAELPKDVWSAASHVLYIIGKPVNMVTFGQDEHLKSCAAGVTKIKFTLTKIKVDIFFPQRLLSTILRSLVRIRLEGPTICAGTPQFPPQTTL